MSTVDREPRSSKRSSIHACARSRPSARSCLRNPTSALSLLAAPSPHMTSSAQTECMSTRFASLWLNFPSSISFVTKATARISRISEELKLISLTRFMISRALVGLSGRSIGLTCTMRMSRDWRIDQREQRRVSHISSVPVVLAVNLDGLIEERQTGRRKHAIIGYLLVGKDPDLPGAHIRRGQEQLD